jgi:hypothetical protein
MNVKGILVLFTFALYNAITNDVTALQTCHVFMAISPPYSLRLTKSFCVSVITNYRSLLQFSQLLSYGLELLPAT